MPATSRLIFAAVCRSDHGDFKSSLFVKKMSFESRQKCRVFVGQVAEEQIDVSRELRVWHHRSCHKFPRLSIRSMSRGPGLVAGNSRRAMVSDFCSPSWLTGFFLFISVIVVFVWGCPFTSMTNLVGATSSGALSTTVASTDTFLLDARINCRAGMAHCKGDVDAEQHAASQKTSSAELQALQETLKPEPVSGQSRLAGHKLARRSDRNDFSFSVDVVIPSRLGLEIAERLERNGFSKSTEELVKHINAKEVKESARDKVLQDLFRKCATGQGEEGQCSQSGFPLFVPIRDESASRKEKEPSPKKFELELVDMIEEVSYEDMKKIQGRREARLKNNTENVGNSASMSFEQESVISTNGRDATVNQHFAMFQRDEPRISGHHSRISSQGGEHQEGRVERRESREVAFTQIYNGGDSGQEGSGGGKAGLQGDGFVLFSPEGSRSVLEGAKSHNKKMDLPEMKTAAALRTSTNDELSAADAEKELVLPSNFQETDGGLHHNLQPPAVWGTRADWLEQKAFLQLKTNTALQAKSIGDSFKNLFGIGSVEEANRGGNKGAFFIYFNPSKNDYPWACNCDEGEYELYKMGSKQVVTCRNQVDKSMASTQPLCDPKMHETLSGATRFFSCVVAWILPFLVTFCLNVDVW